MDISRQETRKTAADMPRVRQSLALVCAACGSKQTYDVGTVIMKEEATGNERFQFTNYFRCRHCDSPGPFEVADHLKIIAEIPRGKLRKHPKVLQGRMELFDGAMHQTVAMSEEYLKRLIAKDPNNAFLHTRMGNLLRGSGQKSGALESYKRAVELDPREIEALSSLKELLIERGDYGSALRHSGAILEAIGTGRRAATEELTRAILSAALYLMNEYAADFLDAWEGQSQAFRHTPDGRVLKAFMDLECDLDEQVQSFVDAALGEAECGEPDEDEFDADDELALVAEPAESREARELWVSSKLRPIVMEASLAAVVAGSGLDWSGLRPTVPARDSGGGPIASRHRIGLTDGEHSGLWHVPSLRALFRGNRQPPPETEMDQYPADYVDLLYCVEYQVLQVADADRDPTDDECIELYAAMRRRPDGRSLGRLHDAVWQAACLALAMTEVSEAEFGAVFGQLTRSVRHFRIGHPSRNYMGYLRSTFGR